MSIILYAITKDNAFCKKNDHDDLNWMKISSDRQFFKFITTLFPNIPIVVGRKTYDLMPPLKDRKIIIASNKSNNTLHNILLNNQECIIIGGYSIIKNIIKSKDLINNISKIITVRLPIITNDIEKYLKDPLIEYKLNNNLILNNNFQFKGGKDNDNIIYIEEWGLQK